MKIDPRLLRLAPLALMLLFTMTLAFGLFNRHTAPDDSRLVGYQVGAFDLPLLGDGGRFIPRTWRGQVIVLNIFASWCVSCAAEHDVLMKLAQTGKVNLYGLAWKDKADKTAAWLNEHGNPYQRVGVDERGQATIPLALTGAPETFVINKEGKIFYHYDAPLTEDVADKVILPLVERLNAGNVTAP